MVAQDREQLSAHRNSRLRYRRRWDEAFNRQATSDTPTQRMAPFCLAIGGPATAIWGG